MTKGIILAGGSGTRLSPVTFSVNKHLMPVYNKPMIHYSLSTLMLFDIKDILIIGNADDIPSFKKLYGNGESLGISVCYQVQDRPNGLAEAFIIGEDFIANDNVVMMLGDNIFYGNGLYDIGRNTILNNEGATLFSYPVKDPERFGVIETDNLSNVLSIEEKPKNPKSNLIATGLYVYDNNVSAIAKSIKPSARGELEITDLNKVYLNDGIIKAIPLRKGLRGSMWEHLIHLMKLHYL